MPSSTTTLATATKDLVQTSQALGRVGLIVVEQAKVKRETAVQITAQLNKLGYLACPDYLALLKALGSNQPKLFYQEQGPRLGSQVLEIVAEFESGIVSLADRKKRTGLVTATYNPLATSLVVILTREQLEKSYDRLVDYVSLTKPI